MGDLIKLILLKLSEITELKFVHVYNSQFDYLENGGEYSFPMPCAFVEIESDNFNQLLNNVQDIELVVKIHIGDDFYNAMDGTFEQNFNIFNIRDLVVKKMVGVKPVDGGTLVKTRETPDYNHSNVYHYVIEYRTRWVDLIALPVETFKDMTPANYANLTEQIIIQRNG